MIMFYFFFFKHKTAYEMRISDWSSDVCSSDLGADGVAPQRLHLAAFERPVTVAFTLALDRQPVDVAAEPALGVPRIAVPSVAHTPLGAVDHDLRKGAAAMLGIEAPARCRQRLQIGRAPGRERVGEYV